MSRARDFANLAGAADAGTVTGANLIINGDMAVAQRGTSTSTHASFPVDRFEVFGNSTTLAFTATQDSDAPDNFLNSLKYTVGTAATAADGTERIQYKVEGYDTANLNLGSSAAQTFTLSFYVKSNVTGTYAVAFLNSATDRNYIEEFTVDTASTWESKTITITGDTSGTWLTDNSTGMLIRFPLNNNSSHAGTADTWQAGNLFTTANVTNFTQTLNATFQITGVKLEVGSTATPFLHESFADNLLKCQRYFCKSYDDDVAVGTSTQTGAIYHRFTSTVSNRAVSVQFPVEMRDNPTVTLYSLNGTSGNVSDCNTGYSHSADDAAGVNGTVGKTGFSKVSSVSFADMMGFHYTAEIEL